MLVHGRFALCGDWDATPTPEGCLRLILTPSFAYSNGWSLWTQAGLTALDATIRPGMTVADIGCGSGILAIAAVLLGARVVYALDVHPEALAATRENATANAVARQIVVRAGSVPPEPVDVAIVSISTAWADAHRAAYDATTLIVVHDDATWEVVE
jgi:ribosomal protein L11 methyltransferase